jgi:DNA (cytosine-5)-methyltransferase 1
LLLAGNSSHHRSLPTNGHWRDADWLLCRDGKWRPVEPGTFPLAHGAANRVGRLRGYGNAIVAPHAKAFVEASMEARNEAHNRL